MKQLKFLMVAFTLLMGISLTSCLDGSNEGEDVVNGIVRVNNYMGLTYFQDLAGNRYFPSELSLKEMETSFGFNAEAARMAHIFFKFVEEEKPAAKAETEVEVKDYDIILVAAYGYEGGEFRKVSAVDEIVTDNEAPLVSISPVDYQSGQEIRPQVYGPEMVMLPLQWKMKDDKEMIKEHSFCLYHVEEAQTAEGVTSGEIVFHLTHDRGNDAEKEKVVTYNSWRVFDVKYEMENYRAQNGKYPTKITFKYKEAYDGVTMPEDGEYESYSINVDLSVFEK